MSGDGWQKWTRNGRLATLVWVVTFLAWIGFKIANIPLEGLDTVFVMLTGAWVSNLGITTHNKNVESARSQRAADKTGDTDG